jgi:hypothetical protein
MAGGTAPQSVNWYIDVVKWLLGIAAGMLVFGFDKLKVEGWPVWLTASYLGSAGLLALAVVFGICACWQWLPYANRIELGHPPTETETQKLANRGTRFYTGMATTFLAGVVAFAAVWIISFLRTPPTAPAGDIKLIPGGAPSTFLVVAQAAGSPTLQVLSQEPNNTYTWKAVRLPKAP